MSEHKYFEYLDELVFRYPRMTDEKYRDITRSIKEHGQHEPCLVWAMDGLFGDQKNWRLIDGRHRQQICKELGIECKYSVVEFNSYREAEDRVEIANGKRRSKTEPLNNNRRNEVILNLLLEDRHRSDREIAGISTRILNRFLKKDQTICHKTVAKIRDKHGLHSDNRKAANGKINLGPKNEMGNFENFPISTESTENATEKPIQAENAIADTENAIADTENAITADTISEICSGIFTSPSTAKKWRPWIKANVDSDIGTEMAKRYDGWAAGKHVTRFAKSGLIDLRIGWPNLGMDFAERLAIKPSQRKRIAELLDRVDDLDRINAHNEGRDDHNQSFHSGRLWDDMKKLEEKPEVKSNVTSITSERHKYRKISFHGEEICWDEIDGMTHDKATHIAQFYDSWYHREVTANPDFSDADMSVLAREFRHSGVHVGGFAGPGCRRVVGMIAQAIERNLSVRQRRTEVDKYV